MTKPYTDKRVLVLDDDRYSKGLTPETFSPLGIELLTASSSEQGLEILSSKKTHVLVTDIRTSGLDFLSTVRRRFPDLAIIVTIGFSDGHLITDTELGSIATTILTQPIKQEDVVVAVRSAFLDRIISSATQTLNTDGETIHPRVLLAEDDSSCRVLLAAQLEKRGYNTTCVEDGVSALEAIESDDFDILLTDIMMPRVDGIELTRKVKRLKPKLPVIVLSAIGDVDASLRALCAGAYCVAVKPVSVQELSLFIDRAVLTEKLRCELREQNALLEKTAEELRKSLNELTEQSDLQVVSRSATVKKLSSDVAHELKNPLNSILASFSYLRNRIPQETLAANPKIGKHCAIVEDQIQRSQEIIESMLDFANPDPTGVAGLQVNTLLRESIRLTLAAAETIDVRFELDQALPLVKASKPRLQAAFTNLIVNAAKAMKNSGVLTIKTETDAGAGIKITFADTGPGVPPSITDRIFDPFFTTDQQHGKGMGLPICVEVVRQCGGTIAAGNAPGGGAVFTITLPQMECEGVLTTTGAQ